MPTGPRLAFLLCALVACGATRAASAERTCSAAAGPEGFGSDLLEDETRGSTAMDDVMEVLLSRPARRKGDDHHHAERRDRSPAKEEP
jgi:hypothetical protein